MALTLAAVALCPTAADASLYLTLDVDAQTFTWSGSATSISFEGTTGTIRLGIGSWSGGSMSSAEASLNVSATSFLFPDFNRGNLVLNYNANSLYTNLGFGNYSSPTNQQLTVTGDNVAKSYTGAYSTENENFLKTLNGTDLFFQNNRGGLGVFTIGPAAGSIVVVPEPSAAVLGLLGGLGLIARRKRA